MSGVLAHLGDELAQERAIRSAFSPSAPISQRDLLAGRLAQLSEIFGAADELGQHLVVFGERGVGKTSLTSVAAEALREDHVAVRVNCGSEDTFSSVWNKAIDDIVYTHRTQGLGFGSQPVETALRLREMLDIPKTLKVSHAFAALRHVSRDLPTVIVFDEFDRISKQQVHRDFADLMKALSDQLVPTTVVIVGVADDVRDLVREHASIERGLAQIHMPRMSESELSQIVSRGLKSLEMSAQADASRQITRLSQGLPHYTHLLAQQAAMSAWERDSLEVTAADVQAAIGVALSRAQESVANLYYQATYSPRENLYREVLAACANAHTDERGYFSASAVRGPLSAILKRSVDIPQFAKHLNKFSVERGPILKKEGAVKKFRYRFVNPLMQPYVIMRALKDKLLTVDELQS